MPAEHFDGIFCDAPYGISFMGRKWDYDVPTVEFWEAVLRVLKPGAPLLCFGGTRTYHRLVCKIEDAGFEIRDCLAWYYLQGFPKSLSLPKAIDRTLGVEPIVTGAMGSTQCEYLARGEACQGHGDAGKNLSGQTVHAPETRPGSPEGEQWVGYGTALKPMIELIALAQKPLDGTYAHNALTHGVAGLNIDGCRIEGTVQKAAGGLGGYAGHDGAEYVLGTGQQFTNRGRWPGNLLASEDAASLLDAEAGERPGGRPVPGETDSRPIWGNAQRQAFAGYGDLGGPSRMIYVAKPDRGERDFGCDDLELHTAGELTDREDGSAGLRSPRAGAGRTGGGRNSHNCVKPITLAKYLATLILPPVQRGRTSRLLVPFAGSGSEMIGALRAGWDDVHGIEREAEYVQIARARLGRWEQVQDYLEPNEVRAAGPSDPRQVTLF